MLNLLVSSGIDRDEGTIIKLTGDALQKLNYRDKKKMQTIKKHRTTDKEINDYRESELKNSMKKRLSSVKTVNNEENKLLKDKLRTERKLLEGGTKTK